MNCKLFIENNEGLHIKFEGQINTVNAFEVEEEIRKILSSSNVEHIIFDFENLTFISSAGLRMILKMKKEHPLLSIENVSPDVYDILEMTGFTSMMEITKKMRVINIEGLQKIGEGYIGVVYRLDEERIIKVYMKVNSMEDVYRERRLAKLAFTLGIPTAITFEIVKTTDGHYGTIYELLRSSGLNERFAQEPENYEKYKNQYVDLLKTIITTKVQPGTLPNKKNNAYEWFDILRKNGTFEEKIIAKLEQLVKDLPDTNTMIHGDYHIKNIMLQDEEPLLIDMDTLGVGHPIFEISAFFLTYMGYPATAPGNVEAFLGIEDRVAKNLYRDTLKGLYPNKSDQEINDINDKIALLGYAWLAAKVYLYEPGNTKRLEHAKQMVCSLIDKVDSLNF